MADLYNVSKEVFAYDPSVKGTDGYVTMEFIGFHQTLEEAQLLMDTAVKATLERFENNPVEVDTEATEYLKGFKQKLEEEYKDQSDRHVFHIYGNRLHHWQIVKSNKTSADIN